MREKASLISVNDCFRVATAAVSSVWSILRDEDRVGICPGSAFDDCCRTNSCARLGIGFFEGETSCRVGGTANGGGDRTGSRIDLSS